MGSILLEIAPGATTHRLLLRGIAMGGLGKGIVLLRYATWLSRNRLAYWGDLDTEGFEILSSVRAIFPHVESFMMDCETLISSKHLSVPGTGRTPKNTPLHLTDAELAAFTTCYRENIRIEQERLPQEQVTEGIRRIAQV